MRNMRASSSATVRLFRGARIFQIAAVGNFGKRCTGLIGLRFGQFSITQHALTRRAQVLWSFTTRELLFQLARGRSQLAPDRHVCSYHLSFCHANGSEHSSGILKL